MITPLPELEAMPHDQLVVLVMRLELQRDNALYHARAQEQFASAARFDSETQRLLELGRRVTAVSPAGV
jgi:hypothetical protein